MKDDTNWMDDAICTPDHAWDSDYPPTDWTLQRLREICEVCPAIAACADHAIVNRCEAGVYAGIWIPPRGTRSANNLGWMRARKTLQRKAILVP